MLRSCGSIVELSPLIAVPSWAKARRISGRRAMISCELGTNPIRLSEARRISPRSVTPSRDRGASRGIIRLHWLLARNRFSLAAGEPLLSELCADQRRQLIERRNLAVRLARQALRPLAIAVAPHDAHAEGRSGISVPGIGRLERDRAGRDREALDGELIDLGVRFVDADQLDRQHSVEELDDPG